MTISRPPFVQHTISALRRLRFVSAGHDESKLLLSKWRHSPITCAVQDHPYTSLEEVLNKRSSRTTSSSEWKTVSYKEMVHIGYCNQKDDGGQSALDKVRKIMLRFENVYPKSVATIVGDWQLQEMKRNMKVGDRFVESIPLIPPVGPLVSMTCMDEVAHIYNLPDRCGFTVVTTDEHDEIGEHTAWVRLLNNSDGEDDNDDADYKNDGGEYSENNNKLILESVSASKFKTHVFGPGLWYARWLQQRAHSLGRQHLREQLTNELQS